MNRDRKEYWMDLLLRTALMTLLIAPFVIAQQPSATTADVLV